MHCMHFKTSLQYDSQVLPNFENQRKPSLFRIKCNSVTEQFCTLSKDAFVKKVNKISFFNKKNILFFKKLRKSFFVVIK